MLLYSHDGTGLGHLRIVLGIANGLAARRPDATLLLLTGSLQAHAFAAPPNLDYVKLPAMPKRPLYEGLPAASAPPTPHKHVVYLREAVARAAVEAFAPHLVVVDHAPAGLFRELATAIESLHTARPRPELALLMRDITFGPEQTRQIWRNEGVYDLLERVYDRILVYGSREVFDPIAEYGLSPVVAAKTSFVGYLAPPPPTRSPAAVRAALGTDDRPLVAVSVGGGADGAPLLRAYLEGLRPHAPAGLASYVVTGPLLPEEDRVEVERLASGRPDVTLVPFAADWIDVLDAADAVVCMGGYNTLSEAAYFGKRAVVVPRAPGPEEQIIRARRFARRGLVTLIPPAELTPERLWRAILAELERRVSPPRSLPFDGGRRVVAELAMALPC